MCVTSRLATSPLDREWQVLLISLRLARISLTALAHLSISGDGGLREWEKECRWCGWTALQSSSYSTISNTSITIPKSNLEPTDIHTHVFLACDIDELQMTATQVVLPWTFIKAYWLPLCWISPAHRLSRLGERGNCSVVVLCKPRQSSHLVALAAKINERKQKGICLDLTDRAVWIFCFHNIASAMNIFNRMHRTIKINNVL